MNCGVLNGTFWVLKICQVFDLYFLLPKTMLWGGWLEFVEGFGIGAEDHTG